VLRGAKSLELSVEQPTRFELPPVVVATRKMGLPDRLTATGWPRTAPRSTLVRLQLLGRQAQSPCRWAARDERSFDAVVEAGAEAGQGFTVNQIVIEDETATRIKRARRTTFSPNALGRRLYRPQL
jgi:hypothetical protein